MDHIFDFCIDVVHGATRAISTRIITKIIDQQHEKTASNPKKVKAAQLNKKNKNN